MARRINSSAFLLLTCLLAAALPVSAENRQPSGDPYEGFNRAIFRFNEKADQFVLHPLAKGYRAVTPKPARSAVGNFFNNLRDVNSFGSNVLRGHIGKAGTDLMRVAVNSTFGLGGLLNIADEAGMPNHKNTLGDTFASWGWKKSNYLVLPLIGPSTVRDSVGAAVSSVYSVEGALFPRTPVRLGLLGLNTISRREQLMDTTDVLDGMALDKYSYTRNIYMNVRNKQLGGAVESQQELVDPEAVPASASESLPAASAPAESRESSLKNGYTHEIPQAE